MIEVNQEGEGEGREGGEGGDDNATTATTTTTTTPVTEEKKNNDIIADNNENHNNHDDDGIDKDKDKDKDNNNQSPSEHPSTSTSTSTSDDTNTVGDNMNNLSSEGSVTTTTTTTNQDQQQQQDESIQQQQQPQATTVQLPKQKPTITILKSPPVPQASISSVMPAIGKRLNVAIDQLEARITSDKYDTEAWTLLLNEVQSQPINIARDIYERFLAVFPTAGRYWKLYVEQEMIAKNNEQVEKIFVRSLQSVRNVELWRTYIQYIRSGQQNDREEVIKAFELALEYIGMDIASTPVWLEYLNFSKEDRAAATNPQDEGHRMNALRRLYQRAVENPMHDIDAIWKEYEQFETSMSKQLAKSMLAEHLNKFQHARNVYRERKALLEGILRNMLAKPPRASDKEAHQVRLWRKLIAYEKTNPQRFDPIQLRNRVTATYNQCLLCLYHYPDIWHEAACYQVDVGSVEAACQFYERGLVAIPNSLFLSFSYADVLESNKKVDKAKEIYEKLITSTSPSTPPLLWIQYMRFARRHERIEGPRKIFKRAKSSPECTYHVYIALSFIEYYINQDTKTARDIFEIGLKKFGTDMTFVNFYVDFLTNLNEENNTRVLFEKILSTVIPLDKSEPFWRKYLDFEYRQNQDLQTVIKLEKRVAGLSQSFENNSLLQHLNRYKFLNLWPCHPNEIEIMSKNLLREDDDDDDDGDDDGDDNIAESSTAAPPPSRFRHGRGGRGGGMDRGGEERSSDKQQEDKPTSQTKIPQSTWKATRPDTSAMILYRNEMGKISARGGGGSGDISPPTQSMNVAPGNMPPNMGPGGMGPGGMNFNMIGGIPDFLMPIAQFYPPPNQFSGPWVDVDQLMMLIKENQFPPQLLQMMGMVGMNPNMNPNMPGGMVGGGGGGGMNPNMPGGMNVGMGGGPPNMGGMGSPGMNPNMNIGMGGPGSNQPQPNQPQPPHFKQPSIQPNPIQPTKLSPPTMVMGMPDSGPSGQLIGKRKIDELEINNSANQTNVDNLQQQSNEPTTITPSTTSSSSPPTSTTTTTTPLNVNIASGQPISSTISSTKTPDNDIYRKRLASKLSKKI